MVGVAICECIRVLSLLYGSVEIVPVFESCVVLQRHRLVLVSLVEVPVESLAYANNAVEQRAKQKVQEDERQP